MTRWKHHRYQFGSGLRGESACVLDGTAAHLVVFAQLTDALVQAGEWQIVAGQHQRVRRYIALETRQRPQIDAERIALRIHRLHADIGTDLGQRLVGTQE